MRAISTTGRTLDCSIVPWMTRVRASGGCGAVPSGARKLAAPSFKRVATASKRTRRSLPRGESEAALPDSRTVMVPSGLIETLLSVGWNWIVPPSPSTRSPVEVTSSPVALTWNEPPRV